MQAGRDIRLQMLPLAHPFISHEKRTNEERRRTIKSFSGLVEQPFYIFRITSIYR